MSDIEKQNATNMTLKTYGKSDLIGKVIEKHRRLLDEYGLQFKEISEQVQSINEGITSAKERKEFVATRTEVLVEKRQLFYHLAEKLLGDISEACKNDNNTLKELKAATVDLPKMKGAISPEDEMKIAEPIFASLDKMRSSIPDARSTIDSMISRMKDAMAANAELSTMKQPEAVPEPTGENKEKGLAELEQKYKWLENRLNSHKEALAYWEKESTGAEEVKV